jgi:hypothetical protein
MASSFVDSLNKNDHRLDSFGNLPMHNFAPHVNFGSVPEFGGVLVQIT